MPPIDRRDAATSQSARRPEHETAPGQTREFEHESAHGPASRSRATTARTRIIGWFLLVVAAVLTISLIVVGQVLLARSDTQAADEIQHEGVKLRAYIADATATATKPPQLDVLLTGFLRDVLPDENETFFSVVDGVAAHRSARHPLIRLDTNPDIVAWAAAATTPESRIMASEVGPVMIAVFPVRDSADTSSAALVVAEFLEPGRAEAWSIIRLLALINFGALILAAAAAFLVAGRVLRPIRQVRLAAAAITETDLTSRIDVTGNDDVAQLAHTFNHMLDRLETAFAAQRDFLDDAGHELRTPLTIIRGHLELMGDDPAERAETTELLLDEVDRMRRLVDDLIVLAQSERPDFLHLAEVDLAEIVVDLVAKTATMAPRQWHIDAVADHRIIADGQRLTQALLQLCTNAVAHTDEGDTIAVGSAIDAGTVRLWVRDTGTGIDLAAAGRIFDRSVRGPQEESGSGTGLGLAIVDGIARAHGGRVAVHSEPGRGATFTIEMTDTAQLKKGENL